MLSYERFANRRRSLDEFDKVLVTEPGFECLGQYLPLKLKKRAQAAIRDVKLGVAVRESARKWSASRSYIQRRLAGVPTRSEFNKDLQVLSPLLEAELAYWAVGQARLGFAPALVKFRLMAQRMLNASGASHTLGQQWHACFLARNESIKTARSKIINYSRVNGATVANINVFFDRLDAPELANIPPERFYNTDEMGIGQGVGGDHWVISEATSHVALKKDVEKGEWITALECVGCDGVALPPLVIFKGADVQSIPPARIDVMTPSVIRNAWRMAGIYPRHRSKPLSSRYVILEDVGVARVRSGAPEVVERESTPDFVAELAPTPIKTPSGGQALRRSGRQLAASDPTFKLPSQRLFIRKASKALDQQANKIASLEAHINYLQAKLGRKLAKVRQKVRIAPEQRFVRMADIRRAKRRLRGRVVYEDETSDGEVPNGPYSAGEAAEHDATEAEECIIVGNTQR
ncbi:uncharacterized protein PG998_014295 [Apiospora kogelbergensis]|uniref:uncharacterized protein n=1 Tax=Apiospora kogelbergensis TaxID=1337665 RepID=UPI00312DCD18